VLARTAQVIVCGLLGLAIGCSDGDVPAPCVGPGGDTPHPGAACAGTGAQGGAGGQAPTIECPESGVYHGPWSLHVDETSAVARWDACKPSNADVTFKPEAGGPSVAAKGKQIASQVTTLYDTVLDTPPDLPGTYWLTEVVLEFGGSAFSTDLAEGRVGVAVYPWEVAVSRTEPTDSAINHVRGEVRSLVTLGNRVRVRVGPLTAEVTAASAERLELAEGSPVVASFKATATRLVPLS